MLLANRAATYLKLDAAELAVKDASKAVSADESWVKAHYRLGCGYAALGQWRPALEAMEKAQALSPSDKNIAFIVQNYRKKFEEHDAAVKRQRAAVLRQKAMTLQRARKVRNQAGSIAVSEVKV